MSSIEELFSPERFQSLNDGSIDKVCFLQADDGSLIETQPTQDIALLPGSFNPLHIGHQQMVNIAATRLQRKIWFEISIANVDKASLSYEEVFQRLKQFEHENYLTTAQKSGLAVEPICSGIVLTCAPTFEKKLRLFPDCVFVVGADTITRINDLRFYHDQDHRAEVLQGFDEGLARRRDQKRFLVFGRWRADVFELNQVDLAPELRRQCDFVSQQDFEQRISSTEIRG